MFVRHLGDSAHLAVIKNAGHAVNLENKKDFIRLLKSFLIDLQLPPETTHLKIYRKTADLARDTDIKVTDS